MTVLPTAETIAQAARDARNHNLTVEERDIHDNAYSVTYAAFALGNWVNGDKFASGAAAYVVASKRVNNRPVQALTKI